MTDVNVNWQINKALSYIFLLYSCTQLSKRCRGDTSYIYLHVYIIPISCLHTFGTPSLVFATDIIFFTLFICLLKVTYMMAVTD